MEKEIKLGLKVEKEHLTGKYDIAAGESPKRKHEIAMKMVKAHLAEDKNYYTKLTKLIR